VDRADAGQQLLEQRAFQQVAGHTRLQRPDDLDIAGVMVANRQARLLERA
jgi:hypothetical protein